MDTRWRRSSVLLLALVLLAACQLVGWGQSPGQSPSHTPGQSPPPTAEQLTEVEAKYALLAELGDLWYCDPDFYPIARDDEQAAALASWAEITADQLVLDGILEHLGWGADRELTDRDKLTVYRQWKVLRAMTLEASGEGFWRFNLLTLDNPDAQTGHHTVGTITDRGVIEVERREDSTGPACPICLARGARIDTPRGRIPVEHLRVGDLVWTVDANGRRIAAPLELVGSRPVPSSHRVVHLVLADGREAWVSAGHPTADGRTIGVLRPGDRLDGARVVRVELVRYAAGATFDLLPAGATGRYWANGILLGSTLMR
jgi:hypothetical protein